MHPNRMGSVLGNEVLQLVVFKQRMDGPLRVKGCAQNLYSLFPQNDSVII